MTAPRFSGRNAIVTGAASGIGLATAQRLATEGANVLGVEFYGAELTEKLVRMLWGGDRDLPRPGVAS